MNFLAGADCLQFTFLKTSESVAVVDYLVNFCKVRESL